MNIGTTAKVMIGVIILVVTGFIGFKTVSLKPDDQSLAMDTPQITTKERRDAGTKKTRISKVSQPKQMEPLEEWQDKQEEELEELPQSFEEEAEYLQPEAASEPDVSQAEGNERAISPELEAIFMKIKDWREKNRVINRESLPLSNRFAALSRIQQEINRTINDTTGEENQRLHRELQRIREEKREVGDILNPWLVQRQELTEKMKEYAETHHGMPLEQFFDTYNEAYFAWKDTQ